ncbi:MAG TPA: PIN domain-containing protein [Chromatiaceae bacterium]|nr:PIN domain-containing protein [Chromatiaceae bacterium]
MSELLVDSNVILDIFLDDPVWGDWSETALNQYGATHRLFINPIIYTELSIGFQRIEELEEAMGRAGFQILEIPKEALFLTGKVFLQYRRNKGTKSSPPPDFFIGAHAAVMNVALITRDVARYRTYFPTVTLISP